MQKIIDISHHQKDFPWDKVKDEIDFTIVRPSHGISDTDNEWADNLKWLSSHPEEKFAVYHYFYYQEPLKHQKELNNFLNHIEPLHKLSNFTGLAFLDFEHPSDVGTSRPIAACTPKQMTDYLLQDCATLSKLGFTPGLYASSSWLLNKMQPTRFPHECVIWVAHYNKEPGKPGYTYRWDIHQYTSEGSLSGTKLFAGGLDLDFINPNTSFTTLKGILNKQPKAPVKMINIGEKSTDVKKIQQILKDRDYPVVVDGTYGPLTKEVIKQFQTDNDLMVDGIVGPQTLDALYSVREFSLARDGEKLVREDCPNFKVKEFACKDGSDKILICLTTVKRLQARRTARKSPCHIHSAYRTEAYNATLKGSVAGSMHTKGYAVDYHFDNVNPRDEYLALASVYTGGLGRYIDFTHLDSCRRRRWNG